MITFTTAAKRLLFHDPHYKQVVLMFADLIRQRKYPPGLLIEAVMLADEVVEDEMMERLLRETGPQPNNPTQR